MVKKLRNLRKNNRLGAAAEAWTRCGNSFFFEKPGSKPPDAQWVDPVNLSLIVTNKNSKAFHAQAEGSISISIRRFPEINLDVARLGLPRLFDRSEWDEVLAALEWWKGVRDTALESKASKRDLVAYLSGLPQDQKNEILKGVEALLAGKEDVELEEAISTIVRGEEPTFRDFLILAIQSGSPAHKHQSELEKDIMDAPSVVDEDLMRAYWSALQEFGLFEC